MLLATGKPMMWPVVLRSQAQAGTVHTLVQLCGSGIIVCLSARLEQILWLFNGAVYSVPVGTLLCSVFIV